MAVGEGRGNVSTAKPVTHATGLLGEGQKQSSGSAGDKQRSSALGLSYVPSPM